MCLSLAPVRTYEFPTWETITKSPLASVTRRKKEMWRTRKSHLFTGALAQCSSSKIDNPLCPVPVLVSLVIMHSHKKKKKRVHFQLWEMLTRGWTTYSVRVGEHFLPWSRNVAYECLISTSVREKTTVSSKKQCNWVIKVKCFLILIKLSNPNRTAKEKSSPFRMEKLHLSVWQW